MRVIFATTCRNRGMHLRRTLPQNMMDSPDAKFLVLDYGSEDGVSEWALTMGPRVSVYRMEAERFRMAHAKNVAHRCAILEGADIVVNLDADNYCGKNADRYVSERLADGRGFLWSRMIPGKLTRGISGRIAVTREAFELSGGYDERFEDWGPDDKDFNARLQGLGFEAREIEAKYLTGVKHTDRMRFREYPEAKGTAYTLEGIADSPERCVVNAGAGGCGWVRNGRWVYLEPRASKVFGIGLHKTGTTSLAKALSMMGMDCKHWVNPRWARSVYENPRKLDSVYAACDLPISVMYRELDRIYPGSKFVLTLRPEEDWVRSVERHWDWERNKFRVSWKQDCFTERVHKVVYGQKGFDREVMLSAYRRHTQEVLRYFRGRDDLLVMNEHGWQDLCEWLGVTRPAGEYPWVDPYV